MLAGSVKAPARYNPLADPDASIERAQVVLAAMDDAGFITDAQRDDAQATRPRVVRDTGTPDSGYFVDWVISRIPGYVGNVDEPIVVETTLRSRRAGRSRARRRHRAWRAKARACTRRKRRLWR